MLKKSPAGLQLRYTPAVTKIYKYVINVINKKYVFAIIKSKNQDMNLGVNKVF